MKCVSCGAEVADDELFCGECGTKIVRVQICPSCNAEIPLGKKFCTKCGTKLEAQKEVVNEEPVKEETAKEVVIEEVVKEVVKEELAKEERSEVNDEAYEKLIDIYLEVYFKRRISEEMGEEKSCMGDLIAEKRTLFDKIIDEEFGGRDAFEKMIISKAKAQGYSEDDAKMLIFRKLYMFKIDAESTKDLISFLEKEGFGDALMISSLNHFILHEEGPEENRRLVPGHVFSKESFGKVIEARNMPKGSSIATRTASIMPFLVNDKAFFEKCQETDESVWDRIVKKYKNAKQPRSYYYHGGDRGIAGQYIAKASYCLDNYFYFYRVGGYSANKYEICRMNLADGRTQVLYSSKRYENSIWRANIDVATKFPLFSIRDDKIYFTDENQIYSMNLDGSNLAVEVKLTRKSNEYVGAFALPNGFLIAAGDEIYRYIYGLDTKPVKVIYLSELIDFNDDVLISKDLKQIDIRTKEKTSLSKIYPGIAKKEVFYVDSMNEIVYYYEKDEKWDLDSTIVGVDKTGTIVDEWNVPYIPVKLRENFGRGYESIVFDGFRLMAKYESFAIGKYLYNGSEEGNEGCPGYLAEYGRDGFENTLYQFKECSMDNQYRFGQFHALSEDMTFALMGVDEKYEGTYYSSLITHDGKVYPYDKFY